MEQPHTTQARSVGPSHGAFARPWVAIVANPFSGAGRNQQIVDQLEQALAEHHLTARVLWHPAERKAVLTDPIATATCQCIIVAGGDGTVGAVINETRDIPLAMLPVGNENLFARQWGFGRIDRLATAVAHGKTVTMDLGCANGRWFSLMLGVGVDAEVAHRLQQWRSQGDQLRRVRRISYLRPILATARQYRYPQLTLNADGQNFCGCHAMVFNINQYAVRLGIAPQAQPDDGLLHWIIFERPGAPAMMGYLLAVYLRSHQRLRTVRHGTARAVRITANTPMPVQIDGDAADFTPLDAAIHPRMLRVIDTRGV